MNGATSHLRRAPHRLNPLQRRGTNATCTCIALWLYGQWSTPPRCVTVFAERCGETGAARPQKRRRNFTPTRACGFVRSFTFVSTTRAPSRRVQRVSLCGCACSAGKRRAGAPKQGSASQDFPPALGASRPLHRARKGGAFVRAGNVRAAPARPACCMFISSPHVPPPDAYHRTFIASGCA